MAVHIAQPDAFDIMAGVEGDDWKSRQLKGDFGDCSFAVFLARWREVDRQLTSAMRETPSFMAMGVSTASGNGAIYGSEGWSRYTVRYTGEILFITLQSPSIDMTQRATDAGFRLFPLPKN